MTLVRVFISSPGDVAQERAVARRVLGRVQSAYAGRVTIEPLLWEQQPLVANTTFQAQLAPPSQADIVIAILWSRLGTPLPATILRADGTRYRSGTEFEIEDALDAARRTGRPRVVLYRKTAEPPRWFANADEARDAAEQRDALADFLGKHLRDTRDGSFAGAFHPFASAADFEELVEIHLHRLVRELAPDAHDAADAAPAAWTFGSPFRGLASFELEHAPLFFGRTATTAAAIDKLKARARDGAAFLLLLGMSGGGKSSLAKAGVLAMLMQPGVVESAAGWRFAILRPGDGRGDVVGALAHALRSRSAVPSLAEAPALAGMLRSAPGDAADALVDALGEGTHLALVVDQLEELFSDPAVTSGEREAFVAALAVLAQSGRVWTVATLRSDFYPRCVELPELVRLKEDAQLDVAPPTPAEIAQMIRMPAAAAGLRFEQRQDTGERLDERLRDVMLDRPAALPLLQFTLDELYRRRSAEGMLTFAAYDEIGGLEGALAHRAEAIFAAQPPDVQAALPRVLEPLVVTGEDDETIGRRHARLDAFDDPRSRQLVDELVEARLLVRDLASDGSVNVSVTHEALLRHWPRAVQWLAANREMLRIRERVRAAAARWAREDRRSEYLLQPGKPFAEAVVLRDSGLGLDPVEREFIDASDRRRRRNRSIRRVAVASLAFLSVAASVAAVVAVRQADIARREATTARRTVDFLASLFAVADPSESRGNQVTARELLDRGTTQIRTELRNEPLVRAGLLNTMGVAYSGLGLYDPALKLSAEARDARVRELGRGHPDAVRSQNAYATALYLSGDYAAAEAAFKQAQSMAGLAFPTGDVERTRADIGLADVLAAAGRAEEARGWYETALRELDRLGGDTRRERTFALAGLATALYFAGRLDDAQRTFAQARTLGEQALGSTHPKVLECANNLASIAYQKGEYARARELWEQTLPQYRRVFGNEHAEVAGVLNNLGRTALLERRFDMARERLDEALALDRRYKDPTHDDLILPLNSLGLARMGIGQYDDAARAFDEAVAIARAHDHWMIGVIETNLADLALRRNDVGAAERAAAAARASLQRAFPPGEHKDEAWRYDLLSSIEGAILVRRGRTAEAQPLIVHPVDRLASRFGETSLFAVDAMRRAAHYYEATGQAPLASAMTDRLRRAERDPG